MSERIVVVLGGALAGPTAAARARELDERARILLLERGPRVSYASCALCYHLSGEVPSAMALDAERAEYFRSAYRIEVWTGAEATMIDAPKKIVRVSKGAGDQTLQALPYDSLIFALGAASWMIDAPGFSGSNLKCLRTLEDLEAVKASLAAGKRRITVIGGGSLGVEAADGLARGGAEVTLIEKEKTILPRFGRQVSAAAQRALQSRVRILTGAKIERAEGKDDRVARVVLADGRGIDTDFVISAVGVVPRTELLARAKARLAPDRSVIVNDRCETSLPDVYACGVCVSIPQAVTGAPVSWPQGAIADKTAQVAGANAAGGNARLVPALGSMLVRTGDIAVGRTGLSAQEAAAHLGPIHVRTTTVHAPTQDRFFPGAASMLVEMVWDSWNGKVLGVEAAGPAGVDKRIDAAAGAIAGGVTVETLAGIDFGYAPPFSIARDPLNVAAGVAAAVRSGLMRTLAPEALKERLAGVQLLDVRGPGEERTHSIEGARALPLEELVTRLGELDKTKPVVTFCNTGRRGYLAARILMQNGFADVANLAGGALSWGLATM